MVLLYYKYSLAIKEMFNFGFLIDDYINVI